MSARALDGARRTACALGEACFRRLGIVLGRWCDAVADWFAERAR